MSDWSYQSHSVIVAGHDLQHGLQRHRLGHRQVDSVRRCPIAARLRHAPQHLICTRPSGDRSMVQGYFLHSSPAARASQLKPPGYDTHPSPLQLSLTDCPGQVVSRTLLIDTSSRGATRGSRGHGPSRTTADALPRRGVPDWGCKSVVPRSGGSRPANALQR